MALTPKLFAQALDFNLEHNINTLVVSSPGMGKTEIVKQVVAKRGWKLLFWHLIISDPTDFKGLPFMFTLEDGSPEGRFVPFSQMKEVLESKEPVVCFMDEFGQAFPAVQASAMQPVREYRLNDMIIPDHVRWVAATNKKSDRSGVQGILEAVKSRFLIHELTTSPQDFINYALKQKWADKAMEVIAFISWKNELLHDFEPSGDIVNYPCPRTVEEVGKMIAHGCPDEIIQYQVEGLCGEGWSQEFMGFRPIWQKLPDPNAIIMNPETAYVPEMNEEHAPAIMYSTATSLAHVASDQNFTQICKYSERLPEEINTYLVRTAINHNTACQKTRAFAEWCDRHQDILM
jgi:hypothetical protein